MPALHDRPRFLRPTFFSLSLLSALSLAFVAAAEGQDKTQKSAIQLPEEVNALLLAAGNAETDAERLNLLQKVQARTDLPAAFQQDLEVVISYVDLWVNNYERSGHKDDYLASFMRATVAKESAVKLTQNNTYLKAIMVMYVGRSRVHGLIQIQQLTLKSPEERKTAIEGFLSMYRAAYKVFPKNRVLGMYCGVPIPWPASQAVASDPQAPQWANLQREGLEKLGQIAHWWVRNRQKPEGFFGTQWGDDVELCSQLFPLTVAFQDVELIAAQRRLSEGIFAQPHMQQGYSSVMTDVEHSAEDSANTITPMLFLSPGEKVWVDRCLRILDLAKTKWTGMNDRKQLQFKATYFNADRVEGSPWQACDTFYHVRVLQPLLIHWQQTGDPEIGDFVTRWMDTWVDASMRQEHGKAAGIIPSAIHWPDGRVGGLTAEWWKPGNFKNKKTGEIHFLFDWSIGGSMEALPNTMLLTYLMTGNKRYLEPIFAMAKHRQDYLTGKLGKPEPEGSLAWAASRMGLDKVSLSSVLAKYRLVSGDPQFDELIKAEASGYLQMRLTGKRDALIEELRQNAEAFRVNFEAYTSECRAGDRLLSGPQVYFAQPGLPHRMSIPNTPALYAAATGNPDTIMDVYCPINAVRWLTPPREIAALVTEAGKNQFVAELYHFGDQPREMEVELLRLEPGHYSLKLQEAGVGKELLNEPIEVKETRTKVKLRLPSRQLCLLSVTSTK